MPKDINIFQYVLIAVFIGLAVVATFLLSLGPSGSGSGGETLLSVDVWGTLPRDVVMKMVDEQKKAGVLGAVTYTEYPEHLYDSVLLEALAAGTAPDLFILNQEQAIPFFNKTHLITYQQFTERAFKDTYVQVGDAARFPGGMYMIPFVVDPMVMYWNRAYFSTMGITTVPKYWDEFSAAVERLTVIEGADRVLRSGTALGEYDNVTHAKQILSLLMLQAGVEPVVATDEHLVFRSGIAQKPQEAAEALQFFTEFSNPLKKTYSWNKSLPPSREAFLSGDVAMYLGFASEAPELKSANPNLDFDVALVPQPRVEGVRATYAKMYSFAIPKASRNPNGALAVARTLSGPESLKMYSELSQLPPLRRDLLGIRQTGAVESVLWDSAIISRTWLEPGKSISDSAFRRMVNDTVSGRFAPRPSVNTLSDTFDSVLE